MNATRVIRFLPHSLEHRTLLLAVLGMGSIMLLYGAWLGVNSGEERTRARMEVTDLLTASTVTALGAPMWDFDKVKVQSILEGLLTDKDLIRATVTDADGQAIAKASNERPESLRSRTAEAKVLFDRQHIGTLRIEVDHDRIHAAVRSGLWHHAGLSAFVVALLLVMLGFIGSRAVRPLRQLKDAISHLQDGNLDRPVPTFEAHADVDAVAGAIEGFRQNAVEMRKMRDVHDRMAATERMRVHAAVESSNSGIVVLDEGQKVVFANGAARRMFPEIGATPIAEFMPRLDPSSRQALRNGLDERKLLEIEAFDQLASRTLAFKLSPITSDDDVELGTSILMTDVSERVNAQQRIERMAHEDALTGLPNRRKFDSELQALVEKDAEIALLMLDLDRFKNVNDTMGHPAGDDLLQQVCARLQGCLRANDRIARLGGDEFAVVLQGANLKEQARLLASRMIKALDLPFTIQSTLVRTGTSVGIAIRIAGGDRADDLVRKADLALYRAKDRTRGTFEFHKASYDRALIKRQKIERSLEEAIANGRIQLDYQPQHSLLEARVTGFEALARWRRGDQPPVSPAEFIPIAEDSGLIEPLTRHVFTSAARIARELDRLGARQRVAVNLSPVLFASDPAALLREVCEATGCDASLLEIEVTEAVFLEQNSENRETLQAIRDMGATIALDDFGTGYSSLSTLLAFPVDRLKIDQAFVRRLDGEPENAKVESVVRTIVDFAHSLDMKVTAEGVETQMQLARLQAIGCDSVQGYLMGRPSPSAHGIPSTSTPAMGVAA